MLLLATAPLAAFAGVTAYAMLERRYTVPALRRAATAIGIVAMAALCIAALIRSPDAWTAVVTLHLAAVGVPLAIIDAVTFTLPRKLVYRSYPTTTTALTVASLGTDNLSRLPVALLASLLLGGAFYGLALGGWMGAGDVRLAPVVAAHLGWVGWPTLATGVLMAFVAGALIALTLAASNRIDRRGCVPFGPALLTGAIGALLL